MDIVVDLDGTLLQTDTLYEKLAFGLFHAPQALTALRPGDVSSRSRLKAALASRIALPDDTLPLNDELLAWLKERRGAGDRLHLCTAANEVVGRRLAARLAIFDDVICSSRDDNIKGPRKAAVLKERFPGGFAYIGDSRADRPVWDAASAVGFAGRDPSIAASVRSLGKPVLFDRPQPGAGLKAWLKLLRVHHWSKNALVFVPMLLAHKLDVPTFLTVLAGLFVLLLATSSTYVLNDLADLEADRRHWTKRNRALARGHIPVLWALIGAPGGICLALLLALLISPAFAAALLAYVVGTVAYSFGLKRVPFLDTFIIGSLFTIRLVMGVTLAEVTYSPWLLTFSMFFFFGLAMAKRHTEVLRAMGREDRTIRQRGYLPEDAPLTLTLGVSTGIASLVIMCLYLVLDAFEAGTYRHQAWLWLIPAVLANWMGRIWILAHRGRLADDPVSFAVRDRVSLALGGLAGVGFLLAR
jgi:4-hydroxybenzoate polyprenyltransferase/phosphoserine phosphatase